MLRQIAGNDRVSIGIAPLAITDQNRMTVLMSRAVGLIYRPQIQVDGCLEVVVRADIGVLDHSVVIVGVHILKSA
jgi:hypothetical protein